MESYYSKIKEYLKKNNLNAEHYILRDSCHSVEEAAKTMNASIEEFVKNICLLDENGQMIVAIVKGEDRASTSRIGRVLRINKPILAKENEILRLTGFPAGGVPSFGFPALFLIDPKVTESEYIFTGGGSPNSLIRININEMIGANNGTVVRVRK